MTGGARVAGAVLAGALLLSGCAADVDGELRREVADLTDDANARDADGVRDTAESLIARAQEAVEANDISPEQGARIIELATLVRDRSAVLEPAEPAPTPEPIEEPEPETETETEEETETEPPPSPVPTQAPPSPPPAPSPPAEDDDEDDPVLPEVPGG